VTAALTLGVAAVAVGLVPVYENGFSSKDEFRQIDKLSGGSSCTKFHEKAKRFGVAVDGGSTKCIFRTPIEGDRPGPDHEVEAKVKVNKSTSSKIRKQVYGAVGVRAGKKVGYELRVFPKRQRWEVHQTPNSSGFPFKGTLEKINGVGKQNRLNLSAFGNRITAKVNGTKVLSRVDENAARVSGRIVTLVAAIEKKTNKAARVTFDSVSVKIPNP